MENQITTAEKEQMFNDMDNLVDGIGKSHDLYKGLMSFFEEHIEAMKSIQNNTDALELAVIAKGYINSMKEHLKDNAKNVLSQVHIDKPVVAPDYSNRRGYITPEDNGYDGNIDAENNPSLHSNY